MDKVQERQLIAWLSEMSAWNRRMNLTAVPEEQGWARHVEEVVELLRLAPPPQAARVADVGSGAGIPGIPLSVLRPDCEVVLIEADGKRAAFLTHVAGLLGLARVRVAAVRAERLAADPGEREGFDVVVSRATAPPAALCELSLPLLRVGGRMVALVRDAPAAASACVSAAEICGGGTPTALGPGLLAVPKDRPTPAAYPRREGMAQRRPL